MKKFKHHFKGQVCALKAVSVHKKFPHKDIVAAELPFLVTAYKDYFRNKGNPWTVTQHPENLLLTSAMKSLYGSKIKPVSYIREIRAANAGKCCSMCGSLSSTQVDHFLPQEHYPEFSVFKPNLFPICGCNQKKLHKTTGPNPGERFLHPAYDRKVSDRSIYVRIRDHGGTPSYWVTFKKPKRVLDAAAFDFHTRTLVSTEAIHRYVKDGFERFCRRPSSVVRVLKRKNPESKAELAAMLCDEIEEATIRHQTKNNWESVFLHALLERRTLNWLWRRLSAADHGVNEPLVAL